MAVDFNSSFSFIGSGIGDLFTSKGDKQSAASLDKAAGLVGQDIDYTKAATSLKLSAASRDIYKFLGGQQSDVAGAGFKLTGTAQDLARDSAQQGYLTTALIGEQGNIDVQNLDIEQQNLKAEAASDRAASKASGIGGLLNIGMGVLGLFGL